MTWAKELLEPKHETVDHIFNPIPVKRLKSHTVQNIHDWSMMHRENQFQPDKIFAIIAMQRSATHMIGRSPGVKKVEQSRWWGDFWMTLKPDPYAIEAEAMEQFAYTTEEQDSAVDLSTSGSSAADPNLEEDRSFLGEYEDPSDISEDSVDANEIVDPLEHLMPIPNIVASVVNLGMDADVNGLVGVVGPMPNIVATAEELIKEENE